MLRAVEAGRGVVTDEAEEVVALVQRSVDGWRISKRVIRAG
ncbi:hypothetical protein O3Q52_33595 [Streptomyces sp. ActVer]|nr:hypothetical protein [Streptomyces sp. ActVer]MCZ4513004.1 hypothetical protein [Streptomyces sp. ActVer]